MFKGSIITIIAAVCCSLPMEVQSDKDIIKTDHIVKIGNTQTFPIKSIYDVEELKDYDKCNNDNVEKFKNNYICYICNTNEFLLLFGCLFLIVFINRVLPKNKNDICTKAKVRKEERDFKFALIGQINAIGVSSSEDLRKAMKDKDSRFSKSISYELEILIKEFKNGKACFANIVIDDRTKRLSGPAIVPCDEGSTRPRGITIILYDDQPRVSSIDIRELQNIFETEQTDVNYMQHNLNNLVLHVIPASKFEDAVRDLQIENQHLVYTLIHAPSGSYVVAIPTFEGSYMHTMARKEGRTIIQAHESHNGTDNTTINDKYRKMNP